MRSFRVKKTGKVGIETIEVEDIINLRFDDGKTETFRAKELEYVDDVPGELDEMKPKNASSPGSGNLTNHPRSRRLSPGRRILHQLRVIEGMSYDRMGRRFDCHGKTVKRWLQLEGIE